MKPEFLRLLILCLFCIAGNVLSAEEDVASSAVTDAVGEGETFAMKSSQVPQMSVVTTGNAPLLAEAEEAPAQGAYTAMAPGICLVVDEFLRQFCSANPDDISCQFQ